MTLERPMFPPVDPSRRGFLAQAAIAVTPPTNTPSNILQFTPRKKPTGGLKNFREMMRAQEDAKLAQLTTFPQGMTITKRNLLLRLERKRAWRDAARLTRWWRARCDFQSALETAQMHEVGDARTTYASAVQGERFVLVELWRAALASQILTPAPDVAAVAWKRMALRNGQLKYVAVDPETLHKAIANDVEWLKDHPVRKTDLGGAA